MALTSIALGASGLVAPPATSAAEGHGSALDHRLLDRELEQVVKVGGGVGAVAEVREGHRVWRGAAGDARVDPDRAARPWMQLRAASVTKMAVAVLALQLVERGRWTLDTTIGDVLPELWPERSDVTLRQLLSHTSGMPEMLAPLVAEVQSTEDLLAMVSKRRTDRELVRAARTQPWLFEPGTGWSYSNTGYVVIGMMLRAETGRSVASLLRQRVFRPAYMNDSRFARTPYVWGAWLREYAFGEGDLVDLSSTHPTLFSSAGALLTTTRDLNRFHRALSTGLLLSEELVRQMRTPVHTDSATGLEYGLGSYRLPDPCAPGGYVHGHDGATFGTLTLSFSSPDGRRQMTVAVTGRSFDDPTRPGLALNDFAVAALEESCPDDVFLPRRKSQRIPTPSSPLVEVPSLG